jgi:hypothetical protein
MLPDNMKTYFKYDSTKNLTTFEGKKLEIHIRQKWSNYGLLSHTDAVYSLGIFDMLVDETQEAGLLLAAMLEMHPSEVYVDTIDDEPHLVAIFKKGDVFIANNDVIENDKLAYVIWLEFICLGNLPKFISYDNVSQLFDVIGKVCGVSFSVNHAIFDVIYAHLFRDPDDLNVKYRLSTQKKKPTFIGLRNISYGAEGMMKWIGSYSGDGLNSALVNKNEQVTNLDIALRS